MMLIGYGLFQTVEVTPPIATDRAACSLASHMVGIFARFDGLVPAVLLACAVPFYDGPVPARCR